MNWILASTMSGVAGGCFLGLVGYGVDRFRGDRTRWSRYFALAGVIVGVTIFRALEAAPSPSIEQQLDTAPAVAVVRAYYPDQYQQIVAAATAHGIAPGDSKAVARWIRPIIDRLTAQQSPHGDAGVIAESVKLMRDEAITLRDASPRYCVSMMDDPVLSGQANGAITAEERSRGAEIEVRLLEQTARNPLPPPEPLAKGARDALAAAAFMRLSAADKSAVRSVLLTSKDPQSATEQRAYCDFTIALLEQTLSAPPEQQRAFYAAVPSPG